MDQNSNRKTKRMGPPLTEQRGYMLMMAAIIIFLVLAMGFNMMFNSAVNVQAAGSEKRKSTLFYAADGVLSLLAQEIKNGKEDEYRIVPAKADAASTGFSLVSQGTDIFIPGAKQVSDYPTSWKIVPEELEGAPRLLATRADRNSAMDYSVRFQRDIVVYAVFKDGISKPSWMGAAWTHDTSLNPPLAMDDDGVSYQIWKRSKAYSASNDTLYLDSERSSSGNGIAYAFRPQNDSLILAGMPIKYRLSKLANNQYKIRVNGYKGGQVEKEYTSNLTRFINTGDASPITSLFPASFVIRQDLYLGRFSHEWSGGFPTFTGDLRSSGKIIIDVPFRNASGPVYFGFDADNADGNSDRTDGIEAMNGAGMQETCRLYSGTGALTWGDLLTTSDFIWMNSTKTSGGGHESFNFAANSGICPSPYQWLVGTTPPGDTLLPELTDVHAALDSFRIAEEAAASQGGITITGPMAGVTEDDLFDWNIRKRVRLLVVDGSGLSIPSDFNGFIYVHNPSFVPASDQIAGVQFVNFEAPPSAIMMDAEGSILYDTVAGLPVAKKGLTVGTPYAIYTVGMVNTAASVPVHLAFIADSWTALSKSWINSLSRFDTDTTDRERSISLHNQYPHDKFDNCSNNNKCPNDYSYKESYEGHYERYWSVSGSFPSKNRVLDMNDIVTNWYFYDRAGNPYRREPRNNPAGASAANNWNHFDATVVKASFIVGYSLPGLHNPPNSRTKSAYNMDLLRSKDANTASYSERYKPNEVRYSDAVHFLEGWIGRGNGGAHWNHPFSLVGSVNLLWHSQNDGLFFGGTLEEYHDLALRAPYHNNPDWLEERITSNSGMRPGRQTKLGSASPPRITFTPKSFTPPGLYKGGGSGPGTRTVGSWRRDYGNVD